MVGRGRQQCGDDLTRQLSLVSGLILFAFATTHFLNHAVGLFDLETMDRVQSWRLAVTRSLPGTVVLAAALVTHIVAGLSKLVMRRTLRLPAWELAQLFLGLAIPFLLFPHIVSTHVANLRFGIQDSYLYELARLWPDSAATQIALLAVVWTHSCLGIHHWLKVRAWYRTAQPVLLLIAIVVPLAAVAGFVVSGRAVAALLADQEIYERMRALTHWPNPFNDAKLNAYALVARIAFGTILALIAFAIMVRRIAMLAAPRIAITYAGGPKVQSPVGPTLLEISRANGVAHASYCGGRARCGTCRVRITEGAAALPAPSLAERFTLARVKAPVDARLACQIRPTAPLGVVCLVQAEGETPSAEPAAIQTGGESGGLQPVCLLYVQMRDIDHIARDRLAYDLLFILNEFFAAAGSAIDRNGGWVDKFLGDGLLAVFGQQHGLRRGTLEALQAARAIDIALDRLNEKVAAEIGREVRVSMGVHCGSFVIGRIGLGKTSVQSVVGLGPNVAQQLAKFAEAQDWQVTMSADVAAQAGISDVTHRQSLTLAGEPAAIEAIGFARGRDIEIADVTEAAGLPAS